jgi:tetratricopeptide (TPR) repeat protein
MQMDAPLAGVLAGTWDRAKARQAAEAQGELETFAQKELPKLSKAAQKSGDWKPVIERLDALEAKVSDPTEVRMMKFQVLARGGQVAPACATARKLLDADIGASGMNMIAWTIAAEMEGKDRDLAVAQAAADKAVSLSKGQPEILDTQARVHFEMGDAAKALEIQRRAVAAAEKAGVDAENLDEMKKALAQYEQAATSKKG